MTQEMTWTQAQSYARQMVRALRAFEKTEGVLNAALLAEQSKEEADLLTEKAVNELHSLQGTITQTLAKHTADMVDADARVARARARADDEEGKAAASHNLLMAGQKQEFETRENNIRGQLVSLDNEVARKTLHVEEMENKVEAARLTLQKLRKGLAGLSP